MFNYLVTTTFRYRPAGWAVRKAVCNLKEGQTEIVSHLPYFFIMTIFEYLGVSKEELLKIDIPKNYITYKIRKNNGKGFRRIDAPLPGLKHIQNIILQKIIYEFKPSNIAHGFVKGRSPKTNAEPHTGKKYIIKIDLKNFFGSIHEGRVLGLLRFLAKDLQSRKSLSEVSIDDAYVLTNILCLYGVVPQGAPSSPALTNLICWKLDKYLEETKLKYNVQITRYADDITVSLDDKRLIPELISFIMARIRAESFRINKNKLRVCSNNIRQQITGVVVNEKLNTSKTSWRNLRAAIHNAKYDPLSGKALQQLRGKIEWLRSLNTNRGNLFLEKFGQLDAMKF